jgi:two-component system KDP operon response regulator KdpE
MNELLARIRAALRRAPQAEAGGPSVVQAGDIRIDFDARCVFGKEGPLRLTPKEFDLLRCLVSNTGKVMPHRKLLQTVWGTDYGEEVEYLRVFINQLRKKVENDPAHPRLIVTEPWIGYRFVLPDSPS